MLFFKNENKKDDLEDLTTSVAISALKDLNETMKKVKEAKKIISDIKSEINFLSNESNINIYRDMYTNWKGFDCVDMDNDGLIRVDFYEDFICFSMFKDKNIIRETISNENVLKLIKILTKVL